MQTRGTIDKLQTLVSSDGRYRNLRDALHRYHHCIFAAFNPPKKMAEKGQYWSFKDTPH